MASGFINVEDEIKKLEDVWKELYVEVILTLSSKTQEPNILIVGTKEPLVWGRIVFDSVQACSAAEGTSKSCRAQVTSCKSHARQSTSQYRDRQRHVISHSPQVRAWRTIEPQRGAKEFRRSERRKENSFVWRHRGVLADGNPAAQVGPETERAGNTRKDKDKRHHSQICLSACESETRSDNEK